MTTSDDNAHTVIVGSDRRLLLGERAVMTALLERGHRLFHAVRVPLADKGFAGREFEAFPGKRLAFTWSGRTGRTGRSAIAASLASASGSKP